MLVLYFFDVVGGGGGVFLLRTDEATVHETRSQSNWRSTTHARMQYSTNSYAVYGQAIHLNNFPVKLLQTANINGAYTCDRGVESKSCK